MNGILVIDHGHAETGVFQKFIVVGVGLNQSRLDAALPNGNNRKTKGRCHFDKTENITVYRVQYSIQNSDSQHSNGKPDHFFRTGNPAPFHNLPDHQGNAGEYPYHCGIIEIGALVLIPSDFIAEMEAKSQLVQIVCENTHDQNQRRDKHPIYLF